MSKIALLPGGFKPPHAGHYNMAKWLSANTGADKTIIFVGPKEREGITQEISLKLWELYIQNDPELEVKPAGVSPVRDVYDFVEQEAPEGSTVYLGMGEKDIDDKRFANISKFAEPRGITFETKLVPPQAGGVSGTEMRGFIKMNDKPLFQYSLPDHLSNEQKEQAWNIVTDLDEDLYNPEDKVLDYMRSSEFKAGYKKKGKISPAYKYKRGGTYAGGGMGHGGMYEDHQTQSGKKKLRVFDFDDTIAETEAKIKIKHADGEIEVLTSGEYAIYQPQPGDKFDFSEFDGVIREAEPIKHIIDLLKENLKDPTNKVTVLTARMLAYPVRRYLKTLGLDAYVIAVGGVEPERKANWIADHIENKGYDDVVFIDDSEPNRRAIEALRDKYPGAKIEVFDPASLSEMMMGMMNKQEKAKHDKSMKRLNKDLTKINKGDQYVKVPKSAQGTLTRKLNEATDDEIAQALYSVDYNQLEPDEKERVQDVQDEMGDTLLNEFEDYEIKYWATHADLVKRLDAPDAEETYMRLRPELTGDRLRALDYFYHTYFKEDSPEDLEMNETRLFSQEWWGEQLTEVLTETKANTHLTHLEELVLTEGPDGYNKAKSFLFELIKNLKGESEAKVNTSVKWDGAPAMFVGINPDNGQFFVGTKSVFNKIPKINYTKEDISKNHGHAPGLADKLKKALVYLPSLGIKNILQGDFMFDSGMIGNQEIGGEAHYTFKPNTITYAVEANSELGKKINQADFGIIFHTTYSDLSGGGASFGADVSGLNKHPKIWFDDAWFSDDTGTVTITPQEAELVENKIKLADAIKVNYLNLPLKNLNIYVNSEIKQNEFLNDPSKSYEKFLQWYQLAVDKGIEKVKRPETKEKKKIAGEEKIREFESQKENIIKIFKISKLLSEAKAIFITKYNNAVYNTKHFVDDGAGGLKVTAPEGYVAVDHIGNGVKLVDRLEFSRANFNAGKPGS